MSDRDTAGRFLKGNPGGPGNPLAPKMQAIRVALYDAVSPGDIGRAVRRLVELTVDPDPKVLLDAIKILFDRLSGKPAECVSVDVVTDTNNCPARPSI